MRIAQVANYITPTSGGLRRTLEALGARYVRAGHRCVLIHPGRSRQSGIANGVRVEQLAGTRLAMSGGYRVITRRGPLQRLLLATRPDIVELSDKTTLSWLPAWLRDRRISTVLIAHDRHDAMLDGTLPDWLPWRSVIGALTLKAAASSSAVVCASAFGAAQIIGPLRDRVHHIPLGVDLDTFHPSRTPDDRRLGAAAIPLAFVARLSPEKRPWLAIETLRELHHRGLDVRLRVVGDGPLRGRLEASAIGLPATFAGHLDDRASVATILAGARATIAPCATETFGLAVLESMACGTPVIVPPDGGAHELVTEGTGSVVTPDATAIADAVCRIVAGDSGEQSRRCRVNAERYSWDATAAAMLELFDSTDRVGQRNRSRTRTHPAPTGG